MQVKRCKVDAVLAIDGCIGNFELTLNSDGTRVNLEMRLVRIQALCFHVLLLDLVGNCQSYFRPVKAVDVVALLLLELALQDSFLELVPLAAFGVLVAQPVLKLCRA